MSILTLPGTRTHEERIRRLRELDASETAQSFEMGDIALEEAPLDTRTAIEHFESLGITQKLKELAEETGIPFKTLEGRRHVASRIPPSGRRGGVNWTVWRTIASAESDEERTSLLELVADDPGEGRWTEKAIRAHLPKRAGASSAPYEDENEQRLRRIMDEMYWFDQNDGWAYIERIAVWIDRNRKARKTA